MTRRKALIAAGAALVIVVVACIAVWQNMDGPRLTPSVYVKPPPPEPEYALEIVSALNEYYSQKGEYPPYLLGGLADIYQLKDPLIESHILQSYPEVQRQRTTGSMTAPIQNIVSSPNDPYVVYLRGKYMKEALAKATRPEENEIEYRWGSLPKGTNLVLIVQRAFDNERFLCGGGVENLHPIEYGGDTHGLEVRGKDIVIPDTFQFVDDVGQAIGLADEKLDLKFFSVSSEFGYQRGEFVGEDKRACWLWFYADEPQRTGYTGEPGKPTVWVVGLDLVDTDDGMISPDGITDGIVLLYKLKDGKVTEVVKDYD